MSEQQAEYKTKQKLPKLTPEQEAALIEAAEENHRRRQELYRDYQEQLYQLNAEYEREVAKIYATPPKIKVTDTGEIIKLA